MPDRTSLGPLVKAAETLGVFARNVPSPGRLLANRNQRFDRLHAIVPSTATPGEGLELTVLAWDQCERLHRSFEGGFDVTTTDGEAEHPARVRFDRGDEGLVRVDGIRLRSPGTHYLTLIHRETGERFVSNPVRVAEEHGRHVFWGDIHVHSVRSDGTSTAETGYRFGRDVMDLDVVAYTDHDTMGFFIPPSWQRARMHRSSFDALCAVADEFHEDGVFVTLPAYEWTKQPNVGGHLNVYFESSDEAELFDSRASESRTYERLWERLRTWNREHDTRVVTIPHHPAEAMYPFDFSAVDYDDELAPVVEVYSQWGSSERPAAEGNPFPLAMGQGEVGREGHHVRDAHRLGYRVGMLGGSDYHGPRPGHSLVHTSPHLPSLADWRDGGLGWSNIWRVWDEPSYPGGLTAFLAPELSRESVITALLSRSVYATTQPHRILVEFRVNGVGVGERVEPIPVESPSAPREIAVAVWGTEPIADVTIRKNTEVWRTLEGSDGAGGDLEAYHAAGTWTDDQELSGMSWGDGRGFDGDAYSVGVTQTSDRSAPGAAWVGPLWVRVR